MDPELDTFLVTVYCVVDELMTERFSPLKPNRPGSKPTMTDSEVLTLTILAQWRADRSERGFLAYARGHWGEYFPRLLSQSAFNRRARDLVGVLAHLGPAIAERTAALLGSSAYEVLDGVPVPLARRCRGERHRCFADEAAIGRGGSDKDWFFGQKLLLSVDAHGSIAGAVSGPANTEERWLADALFRWRQDPGAPVPTADELEPVLGPAHRAGGQRAGPTGPICLRGAAGGPIAGAYLGDLGYRGGTWAEHWRTDYGARMLTKDAYPDRAGRHWLSGLRQVVESVNGWLEACLGLWFPRARTAWGLQTRLAAKLVAFNLALHFNYLSARPPFTHISLWG